jgi:F-type H+-transporting ATPase subunit delta
MTTEADVVADSVEGTVFDKTSVELSRTYGEALVGAAEAQGDVDAALGDLDAIVADVLRPNPKFAELLASPLLPPNEKDRILVQAFEGRALPVVVQFLRVLNRHGRLGLLAAVTRAARAIWDRRQNRRPVSVRSARPLDDTQRAQLSTRLMGLLGGATPVVHLSVDPSLIGGLVVQVGDDVYDASVRRRLEQLRQRLTEGKTHEIQSGRDRFRHPE